MGGAMGTYYSHLSLAERVEIYHLRANGTSFRAIAVLIGRAPSTISREIRRNAKPTKQYAGGYRAERADQLARRRRRWDARFKMQRQPALRNYVHDRLAMGWSPQQIAGRLAQSHAHMRISYESIYRYIYHRSAQKDYWHRLLPQRKNRRGRLKRGGLGSVQFIKHRRPLGERSAVANRRAEAGHWEADLMMFSKYGQGVLVILERLSRAIKIVQLKNKTAAHVATQIARLMRAMPKNLQRSVTFDNGTEFAHHYKLTTRLGIETFFCDPYAPWQKGAIENAIGRLRRPLPRKSDLATITNRQLRDLTEVYNNTPRKCLRYKTPLEVFNSVALQS